MSRKVHRAGAVASAVMLCVILFAAHGSGANAQGEGDGEGFAPIVLGADQLDDAEPALSDPEIRFVASPVVQEVSEDEGPDPAPTPAPTPSGQASLHALVAAMPAAGRLGRELECLAQAVYHESRGEPLDGQLAVARVIINRSASGLFPGDYCSVVTQKAQFSFVRGGRIPQPNERSHAWTRATAIARIAHQDLWPSKAEDALYFHADYVRPRWAARKTARATIDSHIFYR